LLVQKKIFGNKARAFRVSFLYIQKISFRIEFGALAVANKAINVGQGFIDYEPPQYFIDFYKETVNDPNILLHQYTRGFVS
jgi:hypothetical protein